MHQCSLQYLKNRDAKESWFCWSSSEVLHHSTFNLSQPVLLVHIHPSLMLVLSVYHFNWATHKIDHIHYIYISHETEVHDIFMLTCGQGIRTKRFLIGIYICASSSSKRIFNRNCLKLFWFNLTIPSQFTHPLHQSSRSAVTNVLWEKVVHEKVHWAALLRKQWSLSNWETITRKNTSNPQQCSPQRSSLCPHFSFLSDHWTEENNHLSWAQAAIWLTKLWKKKNHVMQL